MSFGTQYTVGVPSTIYPSTISMATPVQIDTTLYQSLKECKIDVAARMCSIGITSSILTDAPDQYDFFHSLTKRHPNHVVKLEDLSDFAIVPNVMNPSALELNIVKTNGDMISISIDTCLRRKSETTQSKFHSALRYSIEDQILAFKSKFKSGNNKCTMCGESLNLYTAHADHIVYFKDLVDDFMIVLRRDGLSIPTDYAKLPGKNVSIFKREDHVISRLFQEYHREHARLRLVCARCNLSRRKPRSSQYRSGRA